MIVVTPSCERSFYMDYRDGSQKWETFIVTELLPEIRLLLIHWVLVALLQLH